MINNESIQLIDKLCSFYETSTSTCPVEQRMDMLDQVMDVRTKMEPGMQKEFDAYVNFLGVQRFGLSGSTEEVLRKLHPWQLQMVVQRFRIPAPSPSGTPLVGTNRT